MSPRRFSRLSAQNFFTSAVAGSRRAATRNEEEDIRLEAVDEEESDNMKDESEQKVLRHVV